MDYGYFDVIRSRKSPDMNGNPNGNTAINGIFPAETPIGMAYVPYQTWEEPYDAAEALEAGTLFSKLNLPLSGEGSVMR